MLHAELCYHLHIYYYEFFYDNGTRVISGQTSPARNQFTEFLFPVSAVHLDTLYWCMKFHIDDFLTFEYQMFWTRIAQRRQRIDPCMLQLLWSRWHKKYCKTHRNSRSLSLHPAWTGVLSHWLRNALMKRHLW